MSETKTILITGATGFIGSHLCQAALDGGFNTWAALRSGSSRRWLQQPGLQFITLDFTSKEQMSAQLNATGLHPDIVIHAGGATKCLDPADFMLHNYQSTVNLVEALAGSGRLPRQMVYLSSLSAIYGSAYGESKLKTEKWLQTTPMLAGTSLLIFRPTGVYGPRERDYFMMAQSIRRHIDFAVGFQPQKLTFVYVADLVGAIFAAINRGIEGGTFNVTDGQVYSSRQFSDLLQHELGVRHVIHITSPLWMLRIISILSETWGRITHRPSTLNRDKYRIMAQRDWTCDISPMLDTIGYTPQWQLPRGVHATIEWYRQQGWI